MGDRICLTFVRTNEYGTQRSPVLYAHWDGYGLVEKAERFWQEYHGKIRDEPANFMVNFISYLRKGEIEDGEYYLYRDEEHSCSPDDCGFWEMDIHTGDVRQTQKGEFE